MTGAMRTADRSGPMTPTAALMKMEPRMTAEAGLKMVPGRLDVLGARRLFSTQACSYIGYAWEEASLQDVSVAGWRARGF